MSTPTTAPRLLLRWTAAMLSALALGHVGWFFSIVAAEAKLARVAERAALEATLPKATRAGVADVAVQLLAREGIHVGVDAVAVSHNGRPARARPRAQPGDRFEVSITAPADRLLFAPIARFGSWFGTNRIRAHAERTFEPR